MKDTGEAVLIEGAILYSMNSAFNRVCSYITLNQILLGIMHLKCLELCLAKLLKSCLDTSVANSANIQTELQDYLFRNNSNENLLPILDFSQAVTVEFEITLIKIKDVVSSLTITCVV